MANWVGKRPMSFDETWRNASSTGWACMKKKNAWEFFIPDISQDSVSSLPPSRAARPSLTYKEIEAIHLAENIYYPGRAEWKPITLTLYDLVKNRNPIWNWIKMVYDPTIGKMDFPCPPDFKKTAQLRLFTGCGTPVELWYIEECWPQQAEFGELDYADGGIVTCDLTLRYSRAYLAPGS